MIKMLIKSALLIFILSTLTISTLAYTESRSTVKFAKPGDRKQSQLKEIFLFNYNGRHASDTIILGNNKKGVLHCDLSNLKSDNNIVTFTVIPLSHRGDSIDLDSFNIKKYDFSHIDINIPITIKKYRIAIKSKPKDDTYGFCYYDGFNVSTEVIPGVTEPYLWINAPSFGDAYYGFIEKSVLSSYTPPVTKDSNNQYGCLIGSRSKNKVIVRTQGMHITPIDTTLSPDDGKCLIIRFEINKPKNQGNERNSIYFLPLEGNITVSCEKNL